MKLKIFTLAFLMSGILAFGQKRDVKDAEKALKKEDDCAAAMDHLDDAESDIESAKDKWKGRYYLAKGNALLCDMGLNLDMDDEDDQQELQNQQNFVDLSADDLKEAGESFEKVDEFGKNRDKDEAKNKLQIVEQALASGSQVDEDQQNFEGSHDKLYNAYQLFPEDTIYLFAASISAVNGEMNDEALDHLKKLNDMGYKGNAEQYIATNKETGEEQTFESEDQMDKFVKAGQFEDPQVEREDRKDGDIIQQLALLYLDKGENEKALDAVEEAMDKVEGDEEAETKMMMVKASVYQEMDDDEKYTDIVKKILDKNPDNPELYYNLGVTAKEDGNIDEAKKYYEEAVDQDPEMSDAYNGLADVYVTQQEEVVDSMNQLGFDEDEKYDKLAEKRDSLLQKAVPQLEKAYENDKDNVSIIRQLYQINHQLKNEDEADKFKEKMEDQGAEVPDEPEEDQEQQDQQQGQQDQQQMNDDQGQN